MTELEAPKPRETDWGRIVVDKSGEIAIDASGGFQMEIDPGKDTGMGAKLEDGLRDHNKVETVEVLGYVGGGISADKSILLYKFKDLSGTVVEQKFRAGETFYSVKPSEEGKLHILVNIADKPVLLRITPGKELTGVKR